MENYKGYTIVKAQFPSDDLYPGCYEHSIYDRDGVYQGTAYSFSEARWMIDNGRTLDQWRA